MTAVFFAWSNGGRARKTMKAWDWAAEPLPLLVSLPYLHLYRKSVPAPPLTTILDSGAFSAWNSGKTIDIDALIVEAKTGGWDHCVALDVIGDSAASVRNAEYMLRRGVQATPVFHYGEDWSVLHDYCQTFVHVGLSCRFGEPVTKSLAWVEQCFAREWPHLFHSFGWIDDRTLMRVPFDTADAVSWAMQPDVYGRWKAFGNLNLGVRAGPTLFTSQIRHQLAAQRRLEGLWAAKLLPLRLASLGASRTARRVLSTSSRGEEGTSSSSSAAPSSPRTVP